MSRLGRKPIDLPEKVKININGQTVSAEGPAGKFSVTLHSEITAKVEEVQRYRTLLVDQLTAPVRFTQAARALIGSGVTVFVEVGPGNVLSGLLKRIDRSVKTFSVNDLEALDEVTEALRA